MQNTGWPRKLSGLEAYATLHAPSALKITASLSLRIVPCSLGI